MALTEIPRFSFLDKKWMNTAIFSAFTLSLLLLKDSILGSAFRPQISSKGGREHYSTEYLLSRGKALNAVLGSSTVAGYRHIESASWPLKKYNGTLVEEYYKKRPWEVVGRLSNIGPPLLGWYLSTQFDNRTRSWFSEEELVSRNKLRAIQLRDILARSGSVTFIKSGQALSLRQDILKNVEYVNELTKLQDEVGTFPNEVAFKIIEEDLGQPANDIFEFVQKEPIASASIGQVYKAIIRKTGKVVALKVQRPDAFSSAAVDMYILRNFARWFKRYKKLRSDLVGIVDEFGFQLFGELDYISEGKNAKRFKELYGNISGIFVPEASADDGVGRRSERPMDRGWKTNIDGWSSVFGDAGKQALKAGEIPPITHPLLCSYRRQILDSGFLHADPHRGNLLKMDDGRLAYLDFGMMCSVPSDQRYALVGATLGLQNKDIGLVAGNLVRLGFLPDETRLDIIVPALEQALVDASDGEGASKLNFTKFSSSISELSGELQFRIPPFYSLIVRTLTILEGLALDVDPDFRLIRGAYPYVAKQVLTNESEEMKRLLEAVLLKNGKINWSRLEELVSIAGAAKIARTDRQFDELKLAQQRSDLRKKIGLISDTQESELSFELTLAIFDYLLSENGRFLREPLIEELLDTAESAGALAQDIASTNSGGLIRKPTKEPDRKKLNILWTLINQVIQRQRGKLGQGAGTNEFPTLQSFLSYAQSIIADQSLPSTYEPIFQRLTELGKEITARSVERQVVRSANRAIEGSIAVFPFLATVVDTLESFSRSRRIDERSRNS